MPANSNQFPSSAPVFGWGNNAVITDLIERSYTPDGLDWQIGVVLLPTTPTLIFTLPAMDAAPRTVKVDSLSLQNVTASPVTVVVTDGGVSLNGGPAFIGSPQIVVPAMGSVEFNLQGFPAVGGVYWSATAANAVQGLIKGSF
jgi:hypothetical protein